MTGRFGDRQKAITYEIRVGFLHSAYAVSVRALDEGVVVGRIEAVVGDAGSYVGNEVERMGGDGFADTVALIEHLDVGLDYRSRGVGPALLSKMLAELQKRHVDEVWLSAVPLEDDTLEMRARLQKFYEFFGFEVVSLKSSVMRRRM